jgi:hypothetical protein
MMFAIEGPCMNMAVLLDKLTEIELAIGVASENVLRNMVIDAQDCILTIQKTRVDDLFRSSRRMLEDQPSASRYAA